MNKTKLHAILDNVYELEGLILLAINRDDAPEVLESLIARKARMVADSLEMTAPVPEKIESEDYQEDDMTYDDGHEPPEILAPFGSQESESSVADEEAEIADAIDVEAAVVPTEKELENLSDAVADAEETTLENIVEDIAVESLQNQTQVAVQTSRGESGHPVAQSQHRGRLVFTLNDRFRFKKELFGNSDSEFNNTLSYVASLENYDEAEDYFLGELQWNPSREEVKDFLEILKKYFK